MEIEIENLSENTVLRVAGDVRLRGHPREEERLVWTLRSHSHVLEHLILNLSEVSSVDSLGVGALVRVLLECAKRQVELKVVLPSGLPGEAIRRLQIFEGCPSFENETLAIHASLPLSQAVSG